MFPLKGRGIAAHPGVSTPLLLLASHSSAVDPARVPPADLPAAAVPGAPLVACTTLHLVDMVSGRQLDQISWDGDFINLAGHAGVSCYGDLLAVLAVRSQQVHLVQVLASGSLVRVTSIGSHCYEDDELELRRVEEAEHRWQQQQLLRQAGSEKPGKPTRAAPAGQLVVTRQLSDSSKHCAYTVLG
ncbi:De-etiolated protein 1 Det1-domain-containing protein [Haematococcus lacustris]